jgi:hypothetical protein
VPRDTTTQIVPGLWMSGSRAEIPLGRFDRVLTLCAERHERVVVPEGSAPLVWRIPDAEIEDPERVRTWARQIVGWMDEGETVLVRCAAGLNRSGLVVARALIERGHSPKEAVLLIREQRRADALNNPWFVEWLRYEGDGDAERIPLPREVIGPQPFTRRFALDTPELTSTTVAAVLSAELARRRGVARAVAGALSSLGVLSVVPLWQRARFRHEATVCLVGMVVAGASRPGGPIRFSSVARPAVLAAAVTAYTGLRWLRLPSTRAERLWARRRAGGTADTRASSRRTDPPGRVSADAGTCPAAGRKDHIDGP